MPEPHELPRISDAGDVNTDQIVQQSSAGARRKFQKLVRPQPGRTELLEDLSQDLWVIMLQRFPDLKITDPDFGKHFAEIQRQTVYNAQRAARCLKRDRARERQLGEADQILDTGQGPAELIEEQDEEEHFINSFPEEQRGVVGLLIAGATQAEIAAQLNICVRTVYTIKNQVRDSVEEWASAHVAPPEDNEERQETADTMSESSNVIVHPSDAIFSSMPTAEVHAESVAPMRFLAGPLRPERVAIWEPFRREGRCLTFGAKGCDITTHPGTTWAEMMSQVQPGWGQPDYVALDLGYTTVPQALWTAPVPLVALATDWPWQWHYLRLALPLCEVALTDEAGVAVMHRQGISHALPARLFGVSGIFTQPPDAEGERDIDILFVGNLNPDVQGDRLVWLERLAQLSKHYRVRIIEGVHGIEYRALLRRAKIVFNLAARDEVNLRVGEACSQGAVLLQEEGNSEMSDWENWKDCVFYNTENFETVITTLLQNPALRAAIAEAGRRRAMAQAYEHSWRSIEQALRADWNAICQRQSRRPQYDRRTMEHLRTWQALGSADGIEPTLLEELREQPGLRATLLMHSAMGQQGWRVDILQEVGLCLQDAQLHDSSAAVNLLGVLEMMGMTQLVQQGADILFRELAGQFDRGSLDTPPLLPGFNNQRVLWEKAALANPGRPHDERREKLRLLLWRLHAILAAQSKEQYLAQMQQHGQAPPEDLRHYYEATLACDTVSTRGELGCALGRQQRHAEAAIHLRAAHQAEPFNAELARSLFQALLDSGQKQAAVEVAQRRWHLHLAAMRHVPRQPWFIPKTQPTATAVVAQPQQFQCKTSLCIIAKNEEKNLPACLESAAGLFDEVVVLDTGSTDRTKDIARQFGARVFDFPWVDNFSAARNACLSHANGEWIFWLDCDDRLDAENREQLRHLLNNLPEGNVGFSMKCRCLPVEGSEHSSTIVDHIRLFKNDPRIRWKYRIHEQILGAIRASGGDIRFVDVSITHTGYTDTSVLARKRRRDLRLLEMEYAEQPNDPFTLFNFGMSLREDGQVRTALSMLQDSLNSSHPKDSIVRKLFSLIAQCFISQRDVQQALRVIADGLRVCPDDAELLFLEATLRFEQDDLPGARQRLEQLVNTTEEEHFASVLGGLRGHRGRHLLAVVCQRLGDLHEAERQWSAVLTELPHFIPALASLAELLRQQGRYAAAEQLLAQLETLLPEGPTIAQRIRSLVPPLQVQVPVPVIVPSSTTVRVRWQGAAFAQHSLGHVNRQITRHLEEHDCIVSLRDVPSPGAEIEVGPLRDFVLSHLDRPLPGGAQVTVRQSWPPDFSPADGKLVPFLPWEFGVIPIDWAKLIPRRTVEVWVPTSFVRQGFIDSGVPANMVHVIPLGADEIIFSPQGGKYALPTTKSFKFLWVGGTIHRKGIDVLLKAYGAAFSNTDDVTLVIKDMGVGSFYRGQTAEQAIAKFRANPTNPEILYLTQSLAEHQMAALYRACDCLVAPYRGEGFGLPIAEAMSCALSVIVTGYGAARDFCDDRNAYPIAAHVIPFNEPRIGDLETVGLPHLAEPDHDALVSLLRHVFHNRDEAKRKGAVGRSRVLERLNWRHSARIVGARLHALTARVA